jgi:hypothetical protein
LNTGPKQFLVVLFLPLFDLKAKYFISFHPVFKYTLLKQHDLDDFEQS